jgi:hypothetical protein
VTYGVAELRSVKDQAVPLRGTAGAPAAGLRVEDARPARARRRSTLRSSRLIRHAVR